MGRGEAENLRLQHLKALLSRGPASQHNRVPLQGLQSFFQDASCITYSEPPIYLNYFEIYICSSDTKKFIYMHMFEYLMY